MDAKGDESEEEDDADLAIKLAGMKR